MRSLLSAIKPGGHMVMIDFHRIPAKMTGRHAESPMW